MSVIVRHKEYYYETDKKRKSYDEWMYISTDFDQLNYDIYVIHYYGNGKICSEDWRRKVFLSYDFPHKLDGPSFIRYYKDGSIFKQFRIYGKIYNEDNFNKILEPLRRKARKFKERKRQELLTKLVQSKLGSIGTDVCKTIVNYY